MVFGKNCVWLDQELVKKIVEHCRKNYPGKKLSPMINQFLKEWYENELREKREKKKEVWE